MILEEEKKKRKLSHGEKEGGRHPLDLLFSVHLSPLLRNTACSALTNCADSLKWQVEIHSNITFQRWMRSHLNASYLCLCLKLFNLNFSLRNKKKSHIFLITAGFRVNLSIDFHALIYRGRSRQNLGLFRAPITKMTFTINEFNKMGPIRKFIFIKTYYYFLFLFC